MKVNIKKFDVKMELKTNGIEFEVRDNNDLFLGDMIINKTGLVWCEGRTTKANGVKKDWAKVIELFNK